MAARRGDEEPEEGVGQGAGAPGAEDLSGPYEDADVETSLTGADEAFLQDVEGGVATSGAPPESEHLADLKRVSAEYANYRRRSERERELVRDRATGDAVRVLLPVLDDLDRAEAHGDLGEGGPLTTIAHKLRAQVAKLGVEAFGAPGETFDPTVHDAIFQRPNPEVTRQTVADVVERGYRIGDAVVRVAKVVVDAPES